MLEAVEQREDHARRRAPRARSGRARVEVVGLDRHDEQPDGRLEPLDGLGMRDGRRLSVDERQPRARIAVDGALGADAERARARGEHPADAAEAEHGDRLASCERGVDDEVHVLRLGVDVERLDARLLPPRPDCLTPPKPMCGSLPCVPALTTTTPAATGSAKRIARWTLAVWIAAVSP